ncbi:MAG: hypothetical protein ACYCSJ_05565 [Acidimicrobiales bacterium]
MIFYLKVFHPTDEDTKVHKEAAVHCPTCKGTELMTIDLRMAGQPMTMHSCQRCERRWWHDSSGQRVDLGGVLALAARDGRRRRRSEPVGAL